MKLAIIVIFYNIVLLKKLELKVKQINIYIYIYIYIY
jgi:hypothetical protein